MEPARPTTEGCGAPHRPKPHATHSRALTICSPNHLERSPPRYSKGSPPPLGAEPPPSAAPHHLERSPRHFERSPYRPQPPATRSAEPPCPEQSPTPTRVEPPPFAASRHPEPSLPPSRAETLQSTARIHLAQSGPLTARRSELPIDWSYPAIVGS
ncbi:hypothetical protein GUJ93_ZPchr0009g1187 [Zizania palustris]|uniref:Uncharacterized protein n=1 Tax=Zizania palustris TaxID=103762 RepID=A0A8J5VN40_ZIZPA|nr:hypothetical protein GUJ93_ZPchr0009g1187 [Zizania palustris]